MITYTKYQQLDEFEKKDFMQNIIDILLKKETAFDELCEYAKENERYINTRRYNKALTKVA